MSGRASERPPNKNQLHAIISAKQWIYSWMDLYLSPLTGCILSRQQRVRWISLRLNARMLNKSLCSWLTFGLKVRYPAEFPLYAFRSMFCVSVLSVNCKSILYIFHSLHTFRKRMPRNAALEISHKGRWIPLPGLWPHPKQGVGSIVFICLQTCWRSVKASMLPWS